MAFCKNCGTLMENDVCPNCGTTNTPVDSAPAPEAQPVYAAPEQPVPPAQPVYAAPEQPVPPAQPVYAAPQQPIPPAQPVYVAPQPPYGGYQPPYYPPQPPKSEEPVSVLGWIWRFLLPSIPVVGWIINLIMLFIWMGDDTKEESFRNWAKAQLVMMAVALGLVVLFFFLMIALGVTVGGLVSSQTW